MRLSAYGWRLAVGLALGLWLAGLAPTASAQQADWSGIWDSRWRAAGATIYLRQDGDIVTGTYPSLAGSLRGEVRGKLLIGTWSDPSGEGEFIFAMAPDRDTFTGRFGTGEWWTGRRIEGGGPAEAVLADASSPRAAFRSFVEAGNAARNENRARLAPALSALDFTGLPAAAAETPAARLALAGQLFDILDQLTFRIWDVPAPEPGADTMTVELHQAGTDERFRVRFNYGVRPNGAAGWFLVVPSPAVMDQTLERLLVMRGGELPHARAHHDLASPRDAMQTFLEQYRVWENTGDGTLLFRTLNLERLGATAREDEAALRAQYLKQVIDRVGAVLRQEIPNNPQQEAPYTHFIHPEGRIEIAPFEVAADGGDGRERIWQFTPETLAAARQLYVALEDMPVEPGLDFATSSVFLQLRNEIRAFDRRLLTPIGDVEIWQWLALVLFLVLSIAVSRLVAWVLVRLILRVRREPDALLSTRARFILPMQFILIAGFGLAGLRTLGLPETVDVPLRIVLGVILAVAGGWFLYNLVDKLGQVASEASGRFRYRDEMLRSLLVAIAKVVVIIAAVLFLAEMLAIPWQGVVAGLSIGGLAIGLAARSTLENFIGGLTLLADKPVRVGDFCQFGGQLGTVESLGLRSVKVRSLGRTVVTIPNGEFINLYLENFSRRDSILLRTTLQLRYETTPDQLRWVLTQLRKLLLQHPEVLAEPSRARFIGFGAHSLDIEIFAYVDTNDWNTYLAVQEDLFLRFIDIVDRSGTGFAFPSTVNYLARDKGVDEELRDRAEASMARLRDNDRLPFPEFADDERWDMFNQLEYPSAGSPHSRRARERAAAESAPAGQSAPTASS